VKLRATGALAWLLGAVPACNGGGSTSEGDARPAPSPDEAPAVVDSGALDAAEADVRVESDSAVEPPCEEYTRVRIDGDEFCPEGVEFTRRLVVPSGQYPWSFEMGGDCEVWRMTALVHGDGVLAAERPTRAEVAFVGVNLDDRTRGMRWDGTALLTGGDTGALGFVFAEFGSGDCFRFATNIRVDSVPEGEVPLEIDIEVSGRIEAR
jgi:hypothetical protein